MAVRFWLSVQRLLRGQPPPTREEVRALGTADRVEQRFGHALRESWAEQRRVLRGEEAQSIPAAHQRATIFARAVRRTEIGDPGDLDPRAQREFGAAIPTRNQADFWHYVDAAPDRQADLIGQLEHEIDMLAPTQPALALEKLFAAEPNGLSKRGPSAPLTVKGQGDRIALAQRLLSKVDPSLRTPELKLELAVYAGGEKLEAVRGLPTKVAALKRRLESAAGSEARQLPLVGSLRKPFEEARPLVAALAELHKQGVDVSAALTALRQQLESLDAAVEPWASKRPELKDPYRGEVIRLLQDAEAAS